MGRTYLKISETTVRQENNEIDRNPDILNEENLSSMKDYNKNITCLEIDQRCSEIVSLASWPNIQTIILPTSLNKLHRQAFDSLHLLRQCIYLGVDSSIIDQIQQNNVVLKNQDCLPEKGWSLEDKHCYLVIRSALSTDSIGPDYVDQIDYLTQHPGVSMKMVELLSCELLPPGHSSQTSLIDKLYAALDLDPDDFRLRQSVGFLTVGDLVNFAKSGVSIHDISSTLDNMSDQENSAPGPR